MKDVFKLQNPRLEQKFARLTAIDRDCGSGGKVKVGGSQIVC